MSTNLIILLCSRVLVPSTELLGCLDWYIALTFPMQVVLGLKSIFAINNKPQRVTFFASQTPLVYIPCISHILNFSFNYSSRLPCAQEHQIGYKPTLLWCSYTTYTLGANQHMFSSSSDLQTHLVTHTNTHTQQICLLLKGTN